MVGADASQFIDALLPGKVIINNGAAAIGIDATIPFGAEIKSATDVTVVDVVLKVSVPSVHETPDSMQWPAPIRAAGRLVSDCML
ncbi:MAG TPA: hypothetical protein VGM27_30850 [Acidobacteriaceae bacterium]